MYLRHAPSAPARPPRPAADVRTALVDSGRRLRSLGRRCCSLSRRLSVAADHDDLDYRDSWLTSVAPLEADAPDSDLGCSGLRPLACQFRAGQHPMARRRFLHPQWSAGSRTTWEI